MLELVAVEIWLWLVCETLLIGCAVVVLLVEDRWFSFRGTVAVFSVVFEV